MVSMEAKFCTSRVPATLCPELERTVATDAELKLALGEWDESRERFRYHDQHHDNCNHDYYSDHNHDHHLCACKMHASALSESVAEVARWATDPVLRQVRLINDQ